jgi:hypothetical protein
MTNEQRDEILLRLAEVIVEIAVELESGSFWDTESKRRLVDARHEIEELLQERDLDTDRNNEQA